jgi:hypothetical protein
MTFHPSKRDIDRCITFLTGVIGRLCGEACFRRLTGARGRPPCRAERTESLCMDYDAARRSG